MPVSQWRYGVIGVLCGQDERPVVEEFFECFKTAWELYDESQHYEVVVSMGAAPDPLLVPVNARILVVYGAARNCIDDSENCVGDPVEAATALDFDGTLIPIYGKVLTFSNPARPFLRSASGQIVGFRVDRSDMTIMRLGYDLTGEVTSLLTVGQPIEFAGVPTLDVHVSLLRQCILDSGVPVVEVAPVPPGYDCIACLTHDVDFLRVTDHGFDWTIGGFLYRTTIGSLVKFLKGAMPSRRVFESWKAALSLPAVHAGICADFWHADFDAFFEIEKDLKATFFFIPFRNVPGENVANPHSYRRAAKYDLGDAIEVIANLELHGFEVGVHGIDAWHSLDKAGKERERLSAAIAARNIGIRMHWLCFAEQSWRILDQAGFEYDSTSGYNETVGYRAGTSQVFRPLCSTHLLELPLHIQDVALFDGGRSETHAWEACEPILQRASSYGGVVTVLWHTRSLGPERFWGDFYIRLVNELKRRRAWFRTAAQVVEWFRGRRAISLSDVRFSNDGIKLTIENHGAPSDSQYVLRFHVPDSRYSFHTIGGRHIDRTWCGDGNMELSFDFQEVQ